MTDELWQPGDIVYASPAQRMYTEREKILAEREAYECGMIRGTACEFSGPGGGMPALKAAVAKAFPLPTVTRPRRATIRLTNGNKIMVSAVGGLLYDGGDISNRPLQSINVQEFGVQGMRELADLLANPTEEVEAE